MAGRSEARIFASIWNDPTFRALTRSQQGMYFFLLSQPDLSFCGVLSLRPRRWAQKAAGLTPEQVQADLKALAEPFPEGLPEGFPEGADNPFIVIDENTEEVFVRSLIRHDGIWKQPNLLKAAREAATLVESPAILRAMLDELKRIPVHESSSTLVKSVMADFITDLETTLGKPSGNPPGKGSANPSAKGPQGKGEGNGDVVEDSPLPKTPFPKAPKAPRAQPLAGFIGNTLLGEHERACARRPPRDVLRRTGEAIDRLLDEQIDPDDIRAGLALLRARPKLGPALLPDLVHEARITAQDNQQHSPPPQGAPHLRPVAGARTHPPTAEEIDAMDLRGVV